MTAWSPKKGTIEIDRTFPTLGRVRLRTGTHDQRRARQYETMLEQLPLATVRLILGKQLDLREVWDLWSAGRQSEIPTADALRPLARAMRMWIDAPPEPVSDSETGNRERTRERLVALDATAKLWDLPVLLKTLRLAMRATGAAFNRHRAACLALVRDLVGARAELHRLCADVPTLEEVPTFARHPCTVAEAQAIRAALGAKWGGIWWALCCHGLGPKEFWDDGWKPVGLGVEVYGQKRPARNRVVPLVAPMPAPVGTKAGFAEALERAELGVTPYDARRSYARWLEEIGLPGYQRDALMGHGPKSMRELYPWGEITAWLAEIGKKLRKHVGERTPLRLEGRA